MRVRAAQNKICSETEVIFDTNFWGSVDVVTTALVSNVVEWSGVERSLVLCSVV